MKSSDHPWELIYQQKGRFLDEPFLGFGEVAEKFVSRAPGKVLDLGCGSGRHILGFAALDVQVFGLDISYTALQLSQKWLADEGQNVATVCADMRVPLPFRDSSFAGVFSTQVIHHALLAEVRTTIAEILRILQPGGLAFVTVSGSKGEGENFEEIEPGTFLPLSGEEKGLPHHIFSIQEVEEEFGKFEIEQTTVRAEGKVLAVLATKPS